MVSHQSESETDLLNTFYNELVSANVDNAKKTYLKLVDNFKTAEYYTKIFTPVYQILNLLKMQKAIYDTKYTQVVQYMEDLMQQKIVENIDNDQYVKNALILVEPSFQQEYLFKVFLSLVHNERIAPYILPITTSLDTILMTLENAQISKTCIISNSSSYTLLLNYLPNSHELTVNKIEQYLLDLVGEHKDPFVFHHLIEQYSLDPQTYSY